MSQKKAVLSFVVCLFVGGAVVSAGACGGSKKPAENKGPATNMPSGETPSNDQDPSQNQGGSSDAGTTPDAGQPPDNTDGGVTADAGGTETEADAGEDLTDGGSSVLCGTTSCAAGQKCCFLGLDAGTAAECRETCPDGNAVACDGPEDCAGGSPLCCFTAELAGTSFTDCAPTSVKSECAASCPLKIPTNGCGGTAQATICRQQSDCAANGTNRFCCPLPIGSVYACTSIPTRGCLP